MRSLILMLLFVGFFTKAQTLLSPAEFLGYEPGDRFTRHHRVVEYFEHVAAKVPSVTIVRYGETYEHRPLIIAVVASAENHARLEQIRKDNLRRAGMEQGTPSTQVAIVWLSYNVHGNESSSMEAAMLTLYELASPANTRTRTWLQNTIVIIDPCVNPDGRDRYANFYNQYGNRMADPNPEAREHREPWPGGRTNHYWFDLNRDWAWLSQIESQQRIKIYNQWMPHVHVDFHEQSYNSPYYFAPAAEPYHEVITPWQREFQKIIGRNNARYFDEEGWLYFTRERFDLFYPSYGDTYPTYNGAIGMTYEQAGGGGAGLTVTTREGDPLTLRDRILHHHTTGLATIEVTSRNANRVLNEFERYFSDNIRNPAGAYKTYVLPASNNPDRIHRLTRLLDAHHIQYGLAGTGRTVRAFDYNSRTVKPVNLSPDDLIISTAQPKSRLITALFEPVSKLSDSVTYDITAWNLFYAYGLDGYALTEKLFPQQPYKAPSPLTGSLPEKPYAYIFQWQSVTDAQFLSSLLKEGIRVRSANASFRMGKDTFPAGSLIITRRNNEHLADFDQRIRRLAQQFNRPVYGTTTGLVDEGSDFGSSSVQFMKAPRIALLTGEQTSSLSAGAAWHFLEQELHYPVTLIGTDYFRSVSLHNYDVLLVPDGRYTLFTEETLKYLTEWIQGGGKMILIGQALEAFADKNGFALKRHVSEEAKKEAEKKAQAEKLNNSLIRYEEAGRREISDLISGAIYRVTLDTSHPLAYGLAHYHTLKTNELVYPFMVDAWNVGVLKGKVSPVQGFAGYKINASLENRLVFGVQQKGRGAIIYFVDDPLFRSFWENGKLLFSNAVFR